MPETREQVAELEAAEQAIVDALEDCLRLIDDMSRFVGQMALRDYALFNNAPIAAGRAIARLARARAACIGEQEMPGGESADR